MTQFLHECRWLIFWLALNVGMLLIFGKYETKSEATVWKTIVNGFTRGSIAASLFILALEWALRK
jgi:hypothetical protein